MFLTRQNKSFDDFQHCCLGQDHWNPKSLFSVIGV